MISAVMARLPDPKIHLAAYGGVVFPIALIIEAPIIMLLAASTALSKDWASYLKIRRFMMWTGGILTAIHLVFAYTPLFYPFVRNVLGAPEEIIEPAKIGMMIMIPWTWTIAYRRFHQGVLIRFQHSKWVGIGTAVRLTANIIAMAIGIMVGGLPGIVIGTSGIAAGVTIEAIYVGIVVQRVLRDELKPAPTLEPALTWRGFFDFYIPLAMTSLLLLIVQPMGSAAISRMPDALNSLAVWPVIGGFMFMFRSMGFAYNEVVVALLDEPGSYFNLRKFMIILVISTTGVLTLVAATPLARLWFETVSGLPPELSRMARTALWVGLLWPSLSVLRNWFQGSIVHGRRTRGITEAVTVFLIVAAGILFWGANFSSISGLYVGLAAFVLGTIAQVVWLWFRSRPVINSVRERDSIPELPTPAPEPQQA